MEKKKAEQGTFKFYASLKYTKLRIWRRFLIKPDSSMSDLAYVLISIFNADGSHLWEFDLPKAAGSKKPRRFEAREPSIGIPDEEDGFFDAEVKDAREITIGNLYTEAGMKNTFTYDFGDNWEFKVKLEAILEESSLKDDELAKVVTGKGLGIIEDCGSIGGLEAIQEAFENQSGEAYEEIKGWFDGEIPDLTEFDIDECNRNLVSAASDLEAPEE